MTKMTHPRTMETQEIYRMAMDAQQQRSHMAMLADRMARSIIRRISTMQTGSMQEDSPFHQCGPMASKSKPSPTS